MNTQEVNEYIKNNTHLSYSELSDILGISYEAVKKRYYKLKLPKKEVVYMKPSKEVEKYLKEKGVGFDDHLKYAVEHYPKIKGIKTYFISGNHDESYKKGFGIDFGKHLNLKRD